ncbi:SulP family inorganic anion transporter [Hoeflea sp. G2-23]|uniref:SulP family inorganic anion transporter n=1 Tax=Hoeflea algicola TaxID=2983763 RepID=A0ABT3Z5K5_9HYPH|nr:cyclic nucleotide-binding domain-containing protein [Hoeflea algicola]MCY0147035.1 SulP family inorganic anion transporter [Hoeflea algicola]
MARRDKLLTSPLRFAPTESPLQSFVTSLSTPSILFRSLSAAAVLAVLNVATAVSIGTLVFSGPLTSFVSLGIGLFLVATAVTGFLVPATSGYKALLAGPRAGQSPIFAAMAATIALTMQGQPTETIAVTVVAAILVTTLVVGAFMFTVGLAKMGTLARYIPFPVMGGFFAGLGYLLTKGGITVAAGPLVEAGNFASFLTPDVMMHLLPAIIFGAVLFAIEQRISHWLLVPTFLAAAIGLFYLVLWAGGSSIEIATQQGWLTTFDAQVTSFFPIATPSQLPLVDWNVVAQQSGTIVVLCILSVIMLLLDISGVEIIINRDLDPNRELRSAGLSNIVGTFVTSPLGFGAAADTAVASKLGGNRFLMIAIYTMLIIAVIVIGPAPIAFVPSSIVGGFLVYIGLSFLIEWVWKKRDKLPFADVLVICIILVAVAVFGILEGVAAGVVLATVLFVHKYSQLSVIKTAMDGAEHVSNIDRHKDDQGYLDQHGHLVQIFVLQGFLFFGSASRLLEKIKLVVDAGDRGTRRFLVIDFTRVDEMDSSAANSFSKLMQICVRERILLCLAGNQPSILSRLEGLGEELELPNGVVRSFADLDTAAGWCDDQLLLDFKHGNSSDQVMNPDELLAGLIGDDRAVPVISSYFHRLSIAAGEVLFEQGQSGDSLYLILSGSVSIVINLPGGQSLTVRTMRAGSILGEMAVYTGSPRSASALARQDCALFCLSVESYHRLVSESPAEAGVFASCIVKLMAERLGRANRAVLALTR